MKIFPLSHPIQTGKDKKANSQKFNYAFAQLDRSSSSDILAMNSFNKYLVNFTGSGLGNTLGKKAYKKAYLVKEEVMKRAQANRVVGNLPFEWIFKSQKGESSSKKWMEKIPENEREAKIKEFYDNFRNAIKDFRNDEDMQTLTERLNYAFHKAEIINPKENLTLGELNGGDYGKGYRLDGIFDGNYVIKIFHKNNELNDRHGNYTEIARYIYLQKNAGKKTQRVPFYFGDIDAGYIVEKFIGSNTPEYKGRIVPERNYGLYNTDLDPGNKEHNKIKGYDIEVGGLEILPEMELLSNNKTARFVYNRLYKLSEDKREYEIYKFLGMEKYRNNKDIKLGIIMAIELLPKKIRIKYINKFLNDSDNEVKKALAYSLRCLPKEDTIEPFTKLLEGAHNAVKEALAYNLDCLPEKASLVPFIKLSDRADNDLQLLLAYKLECLPKEAQPEQFIKLRENSENNVKRVLGYLFPNYLQVLQHNAA